MIVSKLAKEKPSDGLGNLILISGVNIQNLSFPNDDEESECEPDLHQCGKCKQMFVNLERYLRHRTGKLCQKKPPEVQDNSDDASSPSHVPEVVQMEAPSNNYQEYENDQQELANKRKHERKGVARKRTNISPEESTSNTSNAIQSKRMNVDRLQEIIHPEYSNSPPYVISMGHYRPPYTAEPSMPNNNDLYALMELTKNSGIKEVEENNEAGRPHEILNGEVHPTFLHSPLPPASHHRAPGPLALHKRLPAMSIPESGLLPYPGVESADAGKKGAKRRYKCDKCDREFNQRANLRRHQLVHSGEKPFECAQCHRRFQQQGDLKRHMQRHVESAWYQCQLCEKKFMRVDRWKMHMKAHVDSGEVPEEDIPIIEETNGTTEGIEGDEDKTKNLGSHHICSKCNQTFLEPDELLVHTCADGNISVTSVTMETRGNEDVENSAANALVEGLDRNVATDADHSRTYSSSRSASKGKLTNPHKCPLCNAYYKNVDSLKTHILKHSGEKKYKCDQCPKAFFTSSNLKIHKRIHSGDKPLKCKICFKAFSDPSNFNKHKKSHVKGKNEHRPPAKKGKAGRTPVVREVVKEEQGITGVASGTVVEPVLKGEGMEFGSQTHEFLQSQYEALLPALEDGTGEKTDEGNPSEQLQNPMNDEGNEFTVPFVESPSF